MSLKEAFRGMAAAKRVPERPGAQAPRHSGTQAPKHRSTQEPKRPGAEVPERSGSQAARGPGTGRFAKSSHPDFEAVKIYIRKDTHRQAGRRWEDAGDGDFSDLMEMLLQQYLGT